MRGVIICPSATAGALPGRQYASPARRHCQADCRSGRAKVFTGLGTWASAPVRFGCSGPLTVSYRYTGGAPFFAEVDDSAGAQLGLIANDAAASGAKTTTLYPVPPEVPPFR